MKHAISKQQNQSTARKRWKVKRKILVVQISLAIDSLSLPFNVLKLLSSRLKAAGCNELHSAFCLIVLALSAI